MQDRPVRVAAFLRVFLNHDTFMLNSLFPLGWQHYVVGGLFIGSGVGVLFLLTGLVGGASSVFSSTWSYLSRLSFFRQTRFVQTRAWRLVYALGMVLGAWIWWHWFGPAQAAHTGLPWWQLLAGGFLVGYGARLSNGCTSGHGICGLAFLQWPSLLAVLIFLGTAIVVAHLVAAIGVGA